MLRWCSSLHFGFLEIFHSLFTRTSSDSSLKEYPRSHTHCNVSWHSEWENSKLLTSPLWQKLTFTHSIPVGFYCQQSLETPVVKAAMTLRCQANSHLSWPLDSRGLICLLIALFFYISGTTSGYSIYFIGYTHQFLFLFSTLNVVWIKMEWYVPNASKITQIKAERHSELTTRNIRRDYQNHDFALGYSITGQVLL